MLIPHDPEPNKDELLPEFNGSYPDDYELSPCNLYDLYIAFRDCRSTWEHNLLAKAQDEILAAQDNPQAINIFLRYSAMASREFENDYLSKDKHQGEWDVDETARLLMLEALRVKTKEDWPNALFKVFRQCDEQEKISIMRSLRFYDTDGNLMTVALDGHRTNSVDVFSGLVLRNAYPAQAFPDDAFNKLVLKALFLGLDIGLVTDLATRSSATLSQLCIDLVQEQILAKRNPPNSIWLGMRFDDLNEQDKQTYLDYLTRQGPLHCEYCLRGLLQHTPSSNPPLSQALAQIEHTQIPQQISTLVKELQQKLASTS